MSYFLTCISFTLVILHCCEVLSQEQDNINALRVVRQLGWKNVTLIVDTKRGKNVHQKQQPQWIKQGSREGIQTAVSAAISEEEKCLGRSTTPVIYTWSSNAGLERFLSGLKCRRPAASLMLVQEGNEVENFQQTLEQFPYSRSFYRYSDGKLFLHHTFREQNVLLEHPMSCNNFTCSLSGKIYNLHKATVVCETLSWMPWLQIENCEVGQPCQTTGILHDIMEAIASTYNFTWVVNKAESWGGAPLDGKSFQDPDATFGGSFGKAVYDHVDISLSIWMDTAERRQVVDQSFNLYTRPIAVYLNRQAQLFDMTLFLRPFTTDSWKLYIATCICVAVFIIAPSRIIKGWHDNWYSHKIAILFGWLLFILTNAYYGGALTMFFSSSPTLPFNSMIEGLRLYPDWKMIIKSESTSIIQRKQNPGQLEIKAYWDLINSELGKELLIPDYKSALETLAIPGYFLLDAEHMTITKLFNDLKMDMDLSVISKEGYISSGIVLSKYSPLTPIFNEGN